LVSTATFHFARTWSGPLVNEMYCLAARRSLYNTVRLTVIQHTVHVWFLAAQHNVYIDGVFEKYKNRAVARKPRDAACFCPHNDSSIVIYIYCYLDSTLHSCE